MIAPVLRDVKKPVKSNSDNDVEELELRTKPPASLVNKTLLGLLCGSLGFGVSQLTIVGEVRVHSVELERMRAQMATESSRTDARIIEVLSQIKEQAKLSQAILETTRQVIQQNERFITFLAAQQHVPTKP